MRWLIGLAVLLGGCSQVLDGSALTTGSINADPRAAPGGPAVARTELPLLGPHPAPASTAGATASTPATVATAPAVPVPVPVPTAQVAPVVTPPAPGPTKTAVAVPVPAAAAAPAAAPAPAPTVQTPTVQASTSEAPSASPFQVAMAPFAALSAMMPSMPPAATGTPPASASPAGTSPAGRAERVSGNLFRIVSSGHRLADRTDRENYTLLRAAEATKAQGGTHFVLVSASEQPEGGFPTLPSLISGSPESEYGAYFRVLNVAPGGPAPIGAMSADEIIHFFGPKFGHTPT